MIQLLEISPLDGIPKPLTDGDLHLWSAELQNSDAKFGPPVYALFNLLSAEEQTRAQRYRSKAAAEQFVRVRGLLRILLGQYLQQEPESLKFCYSANGKPALIAERGSEGLRFNLSHSRGRVLYAFTIESEIGGDIEALNSDAKYIKLAHRICTAQERLMFDQLPSAEQCAAFFRLWTRKEAIIKLHGERLYQRLSSIEVPIQAESGGFWIQVENQTVWLQDLAVGAGFVGAIALSKCPCHITQQHWDWRNLLTTGF